jgi:hypothetical protein
MPTRKLRCLDTYDMTATSAFSPSYTTLADVNGVPRRHWYTSRGYPLSVTVSRPNDFMSVPTSSVSASFQKTRCLASWITKPCSLSGTNACTTVIDV